MNDALSIARSGMQSAEVRLRNSADNIANVPDPRVQEPPHGAGFASGRRQYSHHAH